MLLRLKRYQVYLAIAIHAVPVSACCLASIFLIGTKGPKAIQSGATYVYFGFATTVIWSLVAAAYQLYDIEELIQEKTGLGRALRACGVTFAGLGSLLFLVHDWSMPRSFVVSTAAILLLITVCLRIGSRLALARIAAWQRPIRVLVLGADQFAARTARRLATAPLIRSTVAAYVQFPGQDVSVRGAKVYDLSELDQIDPSTLDDIVVAVPPRYYERIQELLPSLERFCRPVRAVVALGGRLGIRGKILDMGRMQVIDLDSMPAESVEYLLLKRIFDLAFSSFVIAVTSPLLAVIALAIKLSSAGPVFFRQDRIGLNGVPFKMLKFRSMFVNNESSISHTKDCDPRITPIGRFLRRTSLDEMPQFFNVLKGDMSVVGPRPELTFFVHKFRSEIPSYMSRHTIKCGITGLAQVNGLRGSNTSIAKRVQYDLEYIRNWSLGMDLRIIYLTVITGFGARNAF